MKHPHIDQMIKLNHEGKTLLQIANIIGLSWQYVWKVIRTDKRYRPGKKGFGRMSKERLHEIVVKAGKKSASLGVGHRWDSKEAKQAQRKAHKNMKSKL